jgi:hypothetical protein
MASATATSPSVNLSANDARILTQVFDPESAPDAPTVIVDPNLPADPHVRDPEVLSMCKARELEAIKLVESWKEGDDKDLVYRTGWGILDALLKDQPKYASAYNNRAQLHRWRYGDRGSFVQSTSPNSALAPAAAISSALHDLDTCIGLATPTSPIAAVSPSLGKLLAQAWTQRAAIFWNIAKDLKDQNLERIPTSELPSGTDTEWRSWDRMHFEEEGSRCFFMAGVFGSEVGKAMAVVANPYARLCGSIVKEAMRGEGALVG